jgi:hypothetical protein
MVFREGGNGNENERASTISYFITYVRIENTTICTEIC